MKRPWVTVAAWVVGPPVVAAAVVVLGEVGSLGWPPAPAQWPDWIGATDPAVALTAIGRVGVVAGCVLTSLRVCVAITAGLCGPSVRTQRWPATGPRSLRVALGRLARPIAVAGLGVGVASTPIGAQPATAAPSVATATSSSTGETTGSARSSETAEARADTPAVPSSFAEMRRVRIELASFTTGPALPAEPEVWVVEPGDHLWSIAAETLSEHLGDIPSERRVARYWQRLIDANRDRFVIPGEPDVILPGQHLVLPPPVSGGSQRSGT